MRRNEKEVINKRSRDFRPAVPPDVFLRTAPLTVAFFTSETSGPFLFGRCWGPVALPRPRGETKVLKFRRLMMTSNVGIEMPPAGTHDLESRLQFSTTPFSFHLWIKRGCIYHLWLILTEHAPDLRVLDGQGRAGCANNRLSTFTS